MRFEVPIHKLGEFPEFKGFREVYYSQLQMMPNASLEDTVEEIVMKQCNLPATIAYYSCSQEEVSRVQERGIEYNPEEREPIQLRTRPQPGQQRGHCLIEVHLETIFREGGHISLRQDGLILVRSSIHLRHILGVIEQA